MLRTGPRRLTAPVAERVVVGRGKREGGIFVSTSTIGRNFVRQCEGRYPDRPLEGLGFVDATGRQDVDVETPVRLQSVSSTGDVTGISIALSILHADLIAADHGPVRSAFDTLSILLLYTNFKTITRFVHTGRSRIAATDGLGVFLLDPRMHETQVVHMLEHVCDGRIRVAVREGERMLRSEGLPDQPTPVSRCRNAGPVSTVCREQNTGGSLRMRCRRRYATFGKFKKFGICRIYRSGVSEPVTRGRLVLGISRFEPGELAVERHLCRVRR